MERVAGIEPAYSAWKADILPLNYTRARTRAAPASLAASLAAGEVKSAGGL